MSDSTKSRGRPTKCTPEICARLAEHIREGAWLQTAARAEGIHPNTLANWEKWCEQGKEPYARIFVDVKRAEAEAECGAEKRVLQAPDGWQGAARWLESRRKRDWQRTEKYKLEHSGHVSFPFPDLDRGGSDAAEAVAEKSVEE